MTKEIDDTAFGSRLKLAREAKRYSRSALARETDIPEKSLEKFEYGTMAPSISRVQKLCAILDISITDLIEGKEEHTDDINEETEIEDEISGLDQTFRELDKYRTEGFERYWRTVPQLIEKLNGLLNGVEFNNLLDIAENRVLFIIDVDQVAKNENANDEPQAEQITEIKERIIDTAYFGIDFYTLDENSLSDLAEDLDLKGDIDEGWEQFWSDQKALVISLRPVCRELALKGKCPELLKQDQNKGREVA